MKKKIHALNLNENKAVSSNFVDFVLRNTPVKEFIVYEGSDNWVAVMVKEFVFHWVNFLPMWYILYCTKKWSDEIYIFCFGKMRQGEYGYLALKCALLTTKPQIKMPWVQVLSIWQDLLNLFFGLFCKLNEKEYIVKFQLWIKQC